MFVAQKLVASSGALMAVALVGCDWSQAHPKTETVGQIEDQNVKLRSQVDQLEDAGMSSENSDTRVGASSSTNSTTASPVGGAKLSQIEDENLQLRTQVDQLEEANQTLLSANSANSVNDDSNLPET